MQHRPGRARERPGSNQVGIGAAEGGVQGGGRPALGEAAATASAGSRSSRGRSTSATCGWSRLSATELPLCLVGDLLECVDRQDEREREAGEAEVIRRLLAERDDRLLALLAEVEAPSAVVRKVKTHLARDRESRASAARAVDARLSLAQGTRSFLHHLRGQGLAELRREAESLLERRRNLAIEAGEVERDESITPEDEGIGEFLKRHPGGGRADGEASSEQARQLDREMAERRAELGGSHREATDDPRTRGEGRFRPGRPSAHGPRSRARPESSCRSS